MPISLHHLRRLPVLTSTGKIIGRLANAIVDPATGIILAYQLKTSPPNLISPIDIQSATPIRLVLSDRFEPHSSVDLIRVQKILEDNLTIINKPVRTESGMALGRCTELQLDLKEAILYGIVVKKQLLPFFPKLTLLIQRKNIIDINKKNIIIKDALLKLPIFSTAKKSKAAPAALSSFNRLSDS